MKLRCLEHLEQTVQYHDGTVVELRVAGLVFGLPVALTVSKRNHLLSLKPTETR